MVENGPAGLERTGNAVQVGHAGEIEVRFDVHRPAASDGFDGLYDHPINVWITVGDVVCVANADPLHVARVPIRSGQSWHSTEHASSVSVTSFKRVHQLQTLPLDATRLIFVLLQMIFMAPRCWFRWK